MNKKKGTILVVVLTAALLLTGVPLVTEDSEAEEVKQSYGDAKNFHWQEVEEIFKELFGMTLEEILEQMFEEEFGYDLILKENSFDAEMVTKRDVSVSDNIYTINDHISAYLELLVMISVDGNLPKAGTYDRNENETTEEFIQRIVKDYAGEKREVVFDVLLQIYADLDLVTKVDISTGKVISTDIVVKLMVAESEETGLSLETVYSEDDEEDETLDQVTIGYENAESSSNVYAKLGLGITYDGMKLFSDEPSWEMQTKISAHTNFLFVSSDMANGVWSALAEGAGEKIKSRIPDLILKIISSGSRVLDLVQTIKSLTNVGIRDIDFVADITASNFVDEDDREYVKLDLNVSGTDISLKIAKADYSIPLKSILDLLPIEEDDKETINIIAAVIGWDTFEVRDMDPELQAQYDKVNTHTNEMIKYDEQYTLNIPLAYIVIQILGIIGCAAAVIYMGRRPA